MAREISFWEKEYFNRSSDFVIIGAGLVGLFSAYFLRRKFPSASIRIIERGYPGQGASTKNAGFACFGSPSEILSDIRNMGRERTCTLVKARWEGLQLLKEIAEENMEYEGLGAQELFFNEQEAQFCTSQLKDLNILINKATKIENCFQEVENTSFKTFSRVAIRNRHEGQLNPVSLVNHLTQVLVEQNVHVQYNLNVKSIDTIDKSLQTHEGERINFGNLLICTNGFARQLVPNLNDISAVRNQVLITEPVDNLTVSGTYHMNEGYIYFRNVGNRVLLGGARDLDKEKETTSQFGSNDQILKFLKSFIYDKLQIPVSVKIDHYWSGILGVGSEKNPIVKQIDKNIFLAVRMGGMGVAIGSQVGKDLASLVYNYLQSKDV